MKKKIHINQHNIRSNKDGKDLPVITVKTYKQNLYGHSVNIKGESVVVYPKKPLSCGARVWIETTSAVEVFDRKGRLIDIL